jgi:hypothetical protein
MSRSTRPSIGAPLGIAICARHYPSLTRPISLMALDYAVARNAVPRGYPFSTRPISNVGCCSTVPQRRRLLAARLRERALPAARTDHINVSKANGDCRAAASLAGKHQATVRSVADALLEKDYLAGDEIDALIRRRSSGSGTMGARVTLAPPSWTSARPPTRN